MVHAENRNIENQRAPAPGSRQEDPDHEKKNAMLGTRLENVHGSGGAQLPDADQVRDPEGIRQGRLVADSYCDQQRLGHAISKTKPTDARRRSAREDKIMPATTKGKTIRDVINETAEAMKKRYGYGIAEFILSEALKKVCGGEGVVSIDGRPASSYVN